MKNPLTILFLLISPCLVAQDPMARLADSLASSYLKGIPGSLVIGIHRGGADRLFYYGETVSGNQRKPDSLSLYEAGPVSETFVSLLFARLTVQGIIHSDEKLRNLLPVEVPSPVYRNIICKPADESQHHALFEGNEGFVQFTPYTCFPDPSSKPQEILACDLSTHTTGFPEYPINLSLLNYRLNKDAVYTKEDLYYFLKNFQFEKPLGYDYKHSMLGTSILAHALATKMNRNYDSLLTEQVCEPLNLKDCRISPGPEQCKRKVQGYTKNGERAFSRKYDIFSPATGLHISPGDMKTFLQANISRGKNEFAYLLDYTHNARVLLGSEDKDAAIALGWKINTLAPEKMMTWQGGSNSGFSAFIGFVESDHTGVFILSSNGREVIPTGKNLLRLLVTR